MKKFYITLLEILFCVGFAFAQYPFVENFSNINGPGLWNNLTGQTDVCCHFGTDLCFNCTSVYNANEIYVVQSPNYGTQFADDGCDSITVTFAVTMNIRNGDVFYLLWSDYTIPAVFNTIIPGTGIWTITLPVEIQWLAFQLETFGNGRRTGRYVHVDWLEIDCDPGGLFDIDLYNLDCEPTEHSIDVTIDLSDYTPIELEHSKNGNEWKPIFNSEGQLIEYTHKTQNVDNYYRVIYDGKISNTVYCKQSLIDTRIKEIIYYNLLGQRLIQPSGYCVKCTIYESGEIKNEIKIKNN